MSTPKILKQEINTTLYKGTVSVNTGLFIGGEFVNPVDATGKPVTTVSIGTEKDVDIAVEAAKKAFKTSWGLKVPGAERGHLLRKLADLIEANTDEFAALESLNIGKPFAQAKGTDVIFSIDIIRYYAGFADKVHAKTIETNESKFAYTRREPYGVVGQITPWNAPLLMVCLKIAPALATGNTIVLKVSQSRLWSGHNMNFCKQPSEMTPLTALKLASFIKEIFPPGVVNIVNGYGQTVGSAIAHHPQISKIAFTGSTLTGRKIQEASAKSNLKVVSLELGGKSPNIIFDDTNLDQAAKWAAKGVYMNMGQACIAGSRIFVQEGIYDSLPRSYQGMERADWGPLRAKDRTWSADFTNARVLGYIDSAKQDGATILTGGSRHGNEGFFVQPTIITDTTPDMKVVREEIFGPVATLIKFKTEEEVIEMANNTSYGLACGVFTENNARAIRVAHALEAGTAWVNCYSWFDKNVPFGGYKMSGFGRELGAESIDSYTQVKAVHVNIGLKI
ncbi:aldehyde dehydrogenase [Moniliophthora roreri]|nr:aldehyde dehydrogenase [Moniliophthora roreri]